MRHTLPAALLAALSLAAAAAGPARAADPGFIAGESPGLWRASRLAGLDVLGPDGRKVGTVDDVLVDHDGHAAAVVIGVGGLLGLGRKDVALPFDALHFTDAPRPAAGGGTATAGLPTEPGLAAESALPVETPAAQAEPAGAGAPAPAAKGGPVGTTAGVPGGTVTGQAAAPLPAGSATHAAAQAPARTTARPDHGTVALTAEELKAAPAFAYAP